MSDPPPIRWAGGPVRDRMRRWWAPNTPGSFDRALTFALAPAELLYRGVIGVRNAGYRSGLLTSCTPAVPTISVGNLQIGGTGKTPITAWLVEQLQRLGAQPAILHGGYGGDEPELHRRLNPDAGVFVGRDRCSCADSAVRTGASVLVLDDGFQHRRIRRDIDLVLVSAEGWAAEPRLLPRGPWRETPFAIRRADAVGITRKSASAHRSKQVASAVRGFAPDTEIMRFWLRPGPWCRYDEFADGGCRGNPHVDAGERPARPRTPVIVVAGIAEPHLFLDNVRDTGVDIAGAIFYPDHHDYAGNDIEDIVESSSGMAVVTTAKDAVKLSRLAARHELWILGQSVVLEDGRPALMKLLRAVVQ